MDNKKIIEAWESRVGPETAHIQEGENLKLPALFSIFSNAFKPVITSKKKILDFGCGGGFLGKWLFQERPDIKKYIGMDIADRSLTAANERLQEFYEKEKILLIKIHPEAINDMALLLVDIFACFNVIQHFPTKEYLDLFLDKLENSNIPELLLNVRYGKETKFQDEPYKTTHEINLACWTNSSYLSKKLKSYELKKRKGGKNQKFETVYFKLKEEIQSND